MSFSFTAIDFPSTKRKLGDLYSDTTQVFISASLKKKSKVNDQLDTFSKLAPSLRRNLLAMANLYSPDVIEHIAKDYVAMLSAEIWFLILTFCPSWRYLWFFGICSKQTYKLFVKYFKGDVAAIVCINHLVPTCPPLYYVLPKVICCEDFLKVASFINGNRLTYDVKDSFDNFIRDCASTTEAPFIDPFLRLPRHWHCMDFVEKCMDCTNCVLEEYSCPRKCSSCAYWHALITMLDFLRGKMQGFATTSFPFAFAEITINLHLPQRYLDHLNHFASCTPVGEDVINYVDKFYYPLC